MYKILTIARKEVYQTYTDRNLIIFLFAAPLVISVIVGLAFGGGGDGRITISDIPVVIVNHDEGTEQNGVLINNGDLFAQILVPAEDAEENDLHRLISAVEEEDETLARAGVEDGTYAAAIIIPSDFSSNLTTTEGNGELQSTAIEVLGNEGNGILSNIVHSVADGILNQIATGNIAIAATIDALAQRANDDLVFGLQFAQAGATGSFQPDFSSAFSGELNTVTITQIPLNQVQEQSQFVQILIQTGSGQAVFFALFTGAFGLLSIYDERDRFTLQRMLISPTPRSSILIGKIVGNLLTVFLQIVLLLVALNVIAIIIEREVMLIWGNNIILLILVVIALAICVSGIGTLIVGVARTREQANIISPLINISLAVLGGAFGFLLPVVLAQFSLIYWGTNAFLSLANGDTDIALNLVVLLAQGIFFFAIGSWLFSRRITV